MDYIKESISRRDVLKYGMQGAVLTALSPLVSAAAINKDIKPEAAGIISNPSLNGKVVVIGAGAFGGWAALHLLRKVHFSNVI